MGSILAFLRGVETAPLVSLSHISCCQPDSSSDENAESHEATTHRIRREAEVGQKRIEEGRIRQARGSGVHWIAKATEDGSNAACGHTHGSLLNESVD